MARLYTMLYLTLLVLVVPVESAGQDGNLEKLSEVKIVVGDMRQEEKELGLNKDDIKNHVLVFLRSKLPRLAVKDSVRPSVLISIDISKGRIGDEVGGYFGTVSVDVMRPVIIEKTRRKHVGSLWGVSIKLMGPLGNTNSHIRKVLDRLLTRFAAAWYVDNP